MAVASHSPVTGAGPPGGGIERDIRTLERDAIVSALRDAAQNKSRAARILGLTRTQLYVRLRRYGLS